MNIKDFFARSATGLGGASVRRAAMALLVTVLTATTAWATTIDGVSYIDENGVAQTANGVTVLEGGGATTLSAGWYVVNSKIDYTGTVTLSGNISSSDYKAKLDGKTLTPYMTVAAKEATVDGQTDYWTTLYRGDAGFAIVAEENACAYTATVSGSEITLHRLGKVIPQGTTVIIVGEDAEIGVTTSTADAEYTVDNDLHGVDVATALDDVKTSYGADAILVLSKKGENFGFYELATTNVPARKAFLPINDPSGAREFTMVFDDVAGISEELRVKSEEFATATDWYTLDGRRFSGKPTKSGVYVKGGKKFVIK